MENLFRTDHVESPPVFFKADLEDENARFRATIDKFQKMIYPGNKPVESTPSDGVVAVSLDKENEEQNMTQETDIFGDQGEETQTDSVFDGITAGPEPASIEIPNEDQEHVEEPEKKHVVKKSKQIEFDRERFEESIRLVQAKIDSLPEIDIKSIRALVASLHTEEFNDSLSCEDIGKLESTMCSLARASHKLSFYESQIAEYTSRIKNYKPLAMAIGWLMCDGGTIKERESILVDHLKKILAENMEIESIGECLSKVRYDLKIQIDYVSRVVTLRQMRRDEIVRMGGPSDGPLPTMEPVIITKEEDTKPKESIPVETKEDQIKAQRPATKIDSLEEFDEKPVKKNKASDPTTKDFDW